MNDAGAGDFGVGIDVFGLGEAFICVVVVDDFSVGVDVGTVGLDEIDDVDKEFENTFDEVDDTKIAGELEVFECLDDKYSNPPPTKTAAIIINSTTIAIEPLSSINLFYKNLKTNIPKPASLQISVQITVNLLSVLLRK